MSNTPNPVYEKLMKCYESFRSQIDFQPEVYYLPHEDKCQRAAHIHS